MSGNSANKFEEMIYIVSFTRLCRLRCPLGLDTRQRTKQQSCETEFSEEHTNRLFSTYFHIRGRIQGGWFGRPLIAVSEDQSANISKTKDAPDDDRLRSLSISTASFESETSRILDRIFSLIPWFMRFFLIKRIIWLVVLLMRLEIRCPINAEWLSDGIQIVINVWCSGRL